MTSETLTLADAMDLDFDAELQRCRERIRQTLRSDLHRRGLVVAISGGIDSSVSAALAVHAIGAKRVFGLLMPERDSSSESTRRGRMLADHLGIEFTVKDIAPTLESIGCYESRDQAIKELFPNYNEGWKSKIVIAGGIEGKVNHFVLVVEDVQQQRHEVRLPLKQYLTIVAATNFKQRIRKTLEYFHADRLNYAVVGTPNRLEYDQGFFVKGGDGLADLKPIAHLYKTQVYGLAKHLGLPQDICGAVPTTDTYSLSQGQDEFYFALPYQKMDLALWGINHGVPAAELGAAIGLTSQQTDLVYADIRNKRRTTRYLHLGARLIEDVETG
ncbi:MAG: NAD(+) synthase [Pseudomonadota bacterium]